MTGQRMAKVWIERLFPLHNHHRNMAEEFMLPRQRLPALASWSIWPSKIESAVLGSRSGYNLCHEQTAHYLFRPWFCQRIIWWWECYSSLNLSKMSICVLYDEALSAADVSNGRMKRGTKVDEKQPNIMSMFSPRWSQLLYSYIAFSRNVDLNY